MAELDIAIMGQPPKEMDTRIEAFASHPHGFVASPQNPLAEKINVSYLKHSITSKLFLENQGLARAH